MDAVLFILAGAIVGFLVAFALNSMTSKTSESGIEQRVATRVEERAEKIAEQKLRSSSATIKGQIGERFAPFFKEFGYEPADARFLGSPIDYVVFDGLTAGHVKGVVFVEVKVGPPWLTPFQKQVKQAIERNDVRWKTVSLPDRDGDGG